MNDFDKLQKIVLEGQEKILKEPNKSNMQRYELIKDLIKMITNISSKRNIFIIVVSSINTKS